MGERAMITERGYQLYGPKIAKVILVTREHYRFIPIDSDGMRDRNGEEFRIRGTEPPSETVLYDRAHRGRSWFILDLRTNTQ